MEPLPRAAVQDGSDDDVDQGLRDDGAGAASRAGSRGAGTHSTNRIVGDLGDEAHAIVEGIEEPDGTSVNPEDSASCAAIAAKIATDKLDEAVQELKRRSEELAAAERRIKLEKAALEQAKYERA